MKVYQITRKTKTSVRFKPYGSTNKAASITMSREGFDRLFFVRPDGTAVSRKPLCEIFLTNP